MILLLILVPFICLLLNRWRGTGDVFLLGKLRITGVMIYSGSLALLVGFLSTYYYGVLAALLFIIGESFAWGKWIGYLVSENGEKEYTNTNGQGFPYIHQIANLFVKEKLNYKLYCQIALSIRGFLWFAPLFILFGFIEFISYTEALVLSAFLGLAFPIACELGKYVGIRLIHRYLIIDTNWEKQEAIYGVIQGLAFVYVLFKIS